MTHAPTQISGAGLDPLPLPGDREELWMPYHSFLLRIWSVDRAESTGSPWRVTLVSVPDGGQRTFTRPEALLEFLASPQQSDGEVAPTSGPFLDD